jgi:hypothetical protein
MVTETCTICPGVTAMADGVTKVPVNAPRTELSPPWPALGTLVAPLEQVFEDSSAFPNVAVPSSTDDENLRGPTRFPWIGLFK